MPLNRLLLSLIVAVGFAGCSDDTTTIVDSGVPTTLVTGCFQLSQCIATCIGDGGADVSSCSDKCRESSPTASTMLYDALQACITTTCSSTDDDAGTSVCNDSSSIECMRCKTNAQYKTASECGGAPAYCGACASQQAACRDD